ncbi:MAG: hypothetical protein ACE14V_04605 [bacterium]
MNIKPESGFGGYEIISLLPANLFDRSSGMPVSSPLRIGQAGASG